MRIIGIDPGFAILGWAVIEKDLKLVDYGVITTDKSSDFSERLYQIHESLSGIIAEFKPETAALEKLFFTKNVTTGMQVAQCVGAVILTLKIHKLDYSEYTPLQVKQSVTGSGRASKIQMQGAIKTIFNLKAIPKPDDAADAVAVAACHSLKLGSQKILNQM